MKPADYAFFKENGYISLGKILSDAEVAHFVHVFDRDHTEVADHWYPYWTLPDRELRCTSDFP